MHELSSEEVRMYAGPLTRERMARRAQRVRIFKGVAIAVILVAVFIASGILETQRIQVMEQTSVEATMAANAIIR